MATNSDDWGIQVSIKHGPNQSYMTNVRGYTASEIADHLRHLGEKAQEIQTGIIAFLATETIRNEFPDTQPVRESRYGNDDRNSGGGGERCAVHGLPRVFRSGEKNGKRWAGWMCAAEKHQNPCAPKWAD